jgi:thiosulfate/3-mercaptopyruvate sulfurtransferase
MSWQAGRVQASSVAAFRVVQIALTAGLLAFVCCLCVRAQQSPAKTSASSDTAIPSPDRLEPDEVSRLMQGSDKPLILQVGSHVFYAEAHIPGSEYVGAVGTSAGIQALRERVSGLKRDQLIIIYCGCCPWDRCPNIRPAYTELHALGFTRVKTMYVAENFGANWVKKGYPVAAGR